MHPSTAFLRASLRLWRRRQAYRYKRLAAAKRRRDERRIKHWQQLVDEASREVGRRRMQLAKHKPLRAHAADVMEQWAREGVHEQGGNNVGPQVSRIIREAGGTPGEPWCGDAVAAAYLAGARKLGAGVAARANRKVTRAWAYVPTLEQILTRVRRPRRGHVVIFNFDGGAPDHTGLFLRDNGDGTIRTVEGNTRPGTATSDAGGGEGVYVRDRPKSIVQSYRRVRV